MPASPPHGRASAPASAAGTLYTGTDDGYLNAHHASDGTLIWRIHLGELTFGTPIAAPTAVYIGASDGAIYAHRASDGALLWRTFVSTSVTVVSSMSIRAASVHSAPPYSAPPHSAPPNGPHDPPPDPPAAA